MNTIFLDKMVELYLVTGLWSTFDYHDEDESGNSPNLDDNYGVSDISDEFKKKAKEECLSFYNLTSHLYVADEKDAGRIGHDFWLTRNRHGAGFWDGDYIQGKALTTICNTHFKDNSDELNEAIIREENDNEENN